MKRPLWLLVLGYMLALHVVIGVLVWKTNFLLLAGKTIGLLPPEEWSLPLYARILDQARRDETVRPGGVALLGDSLMEQLDAGLIAADAVNFGHGGSTTRTLAVEMPVLRSLEQSRGVVLEIGVNDLKYRPIDAIAHDYALVLDQLATAPWLLAISVLPVDPNGDAARQRSYLRNDTIAALNNKLRAVCQARPDCRFVDVSVSVSRGDAYGPDGWHLSAAGNHALASMIRDHLPSSN
jgi:lysophospholipase L1-like esterase